MFTHDLDFGTLLALTQAKGPSVLQLRSRDSMPKHLHLQVIEAVKHFESVLEQGALITIEVKRTKVRILPLKK